MIKKKKHPCPVVSMPPVCAQRRSIARFSRKNHSLTIWLHKLAPVLVFTICSVSILKSKSAPVANVKPDRSGQAANHSDWQSSLKSYVGKTSLAVVQFFGDFNSGDIYVSAPCPLHIRTSIAQARLTQASQVPVVLLGGKNCQALSAIKGVIVLPADRYYPTTQRNQGLFVPGYKQRQSMGPARALKQEVCVLRWFALLDFMRTEDVPSVVMTDSDTILYASALELKNSLDEAGCSFAMPLDGDLPLPPSFVYITTEALEDFVLFARELIHWSSDERREPSANDMRIFALYAYSARDDTSREIPQGMRDAGVRRAILDGSLPRPKFRVCSMSNLTGSQSTVFDKNLGFSSLGSFQMIPKDASRPGDAKVKAIQLPISSESFPAPRFVLSNGDVVRVGGMHFQGGKKKFMGRFTVHPAKHPTCQWQRWVTSRKSRIRKYKWQGSMYNASTCYCQDLACLNCPTVLCQNEGIFA